ncbi:hypothetical protein [Sinorhizobium fredii]|uniref:hypothetical protein n=1 Tax=Rhizobium fredii TaxID=380 RepID=UPI0012FDC9F8|nr:hypothetical protein [Sinorhizobium fredii]
MTQFPISNNPRRMGRPPLKVKPILVRLPEGMPERIDALVGKNKRAEFIRQAVESELLRREKKSAGEADE